MSDDLERPMGQCSACGWLVPMDAIGDHLRRIHPQIARAIESDNGPIEAQIAAAVVVDQTGQARP